MNWDEWTGYLEELVGHGAGGQSIYLLAPSHGEDDLSQDEEDDLAEAVHHRFFTGNSPRTTLIYLFARPARESLPLLYLSALLARHQENRLAFWPSFNQAVIRGRLSSQTVQQALAPLITNLWWNMHEQWRIYRPGEGRVHVKWPQAHAGLTESEVDLLANLLAKTMGWSEEPPPILDADPDEFLGQLRVWLQFESHTHWQLQRLVFGPDGPALEIAELAQRVLYEHWPPTRKVYEKGQGPQTSSPYLMLSYEPLALSIVLPEGSIQGYSLVYARYGDDWVQLETSFFPQSQTTRYSSYRWHLNQIPWPREVTLAYDNRKVELRVRPECPFGKQRYAALMFEAATSRFVKRWRPNSQYLLLLPQDELPDWVNILFADVEVVDVGQLGDYNLQVISAMGRDITSDLGRIEASRLLQYLEGELWRTGALISLPDLDNLLRPAISLCDGMLINDGPCPTYLADTPPAVLVQNAHRTDTMLSALRRYDDGSEVCVASASLVAEGYEHHALVYFPQLDEGSYVIRGVQQPQYFNLVAEPVERPSSTMEVKLHLLHSEVVAASDDIRHFRDRGVEIRAWPYAPITLTVQTEAGTNSYPLRLGADGVRIVRAYEIDLPTSTPWIRLQVTCWLARSEAVDLTVRPYVAQSEWTLEHGSFRARVRGAEPGTDCRLSLVATRPWAMPMYEVQSVVGADSFVRSKLTTQISNGWLILADSASDLAWLLSSVGASVEEYSFADFQQAYEHDVILPDYILGAGWGDSGFCKMRSLVQVARLAKLALIPSLASPIPENLAALSRGQNLQKTILVQLPPDWGGHVAKIVLFPDPQRGGLMQLGGRELRIQIVSIGELSWAVWDESSAPRVCGACRGMMTESQWHTHRCGGVDDRPFQVPRRAFRLMQYVDWPGIMDSIEQLLLDAVAEESTEGPNGLEAVWASLQETFRSRPKSPPMSPADWIKGSTAGWRLLFDVLNNRQPTVDWLSISDTVRPFENGIVALARMFE